MINHFFYAGNNERKAWLGCGPCKWEVEIFLSEIKMPETIQTWQWEMEQLHKVH